MTATDERLIYLFIYLFIDLVLVIYCLKVNLLKNVTLCGNLIKVVTFTKVTINCLL